VLVAEKYQKNIYFNDFSGNRRQERSQDLLYLRNCLSPLGFPNWFFRDLKGCLFRRQANQAIAIKGW
jgi:hypothetical protein